MIPYVQVLYSHSDSDSDELSCLNTDVNKAKIDTIDMRILFVLYSLGQSHSESRGGFMIIASDDCRTWMSSDLTPPLFYCVTVR